MDKRKLGGNSDYQMVPRVPQGLAAAVEGLTREIIRNSPEDIYVFAANHFEKLLQLRDKCEFDENPREINETLNISTEELNNEENPRRTTTNRNSEHQVGWSFGQTAKVLKRHRSLFGDAAGRRISSDQVFRMANEKENRCRGSKSMERKGKSRVNRGYCQKKEESSGNSWSNDDSSEIIINSHELRSGPRILMQSSKGLLAKDIKTELRKNRMSSKERSGNKSSERQEERINRRSINSTKLSRERVEELESLSNVEKFHKIIEDIDPIIKKKLEKSCSWFNDEYSQVSNDSNENYNENDGKKCTKTRFTQTEHRNMNISSKMLTKPRRSRSATNSRRSLKFEEEILSGKHSSEENSSLERKLCKTLNLFEDISSRLSSRLAKRSNSTNSLRKHVDDDDFNDDHVTKGKHNERQHFFEDISKNFAMPRQRVDSSKDQESDHIGNCLGNEINLSDSENRVKLLPAVSRSVSAKCSSASSGSRSTDSLVLPEISSEAPKSKKIKEELILPVLSPPGVNLSNESMKIGEEIDIFQENYVPDVFGDSLNVTPNFDNTPQRPDSLEAPETARDIETEQEFISKISDNSQEPEDLGDSLIKKKLLELEEAEKRIERIFDSEVVSEENKDSSKAETEANDASKESGNTVEGERVAESISANGSEINEKEEDESKNEKQERFNSSASSPEPLIYTYVLTEGSPDEIPDTVTTVIIPEGALESPESDKLSEDTKVPLVSSLNKNLDPFGELIEPEAMESICPEIDFSRSIETRRDLRLSRRNLGPINEQVFEELEDEEEQEEMNNILESKAAIENKEVTTTEREKEVDDKVLKVKIDESPDLSPETVASRLDIDSESSNEAKESSGLEETLGSTKRDNSVDEEESNNTRSSVESSNEAKETTLTDGLSLSLDPTRPFVPELNLDSLRDLTVSSFKITDDEYENEGHEESGKTNSITDNTLTSEDNYVEVVENVSSLDQSKKEDVELDQSEVVEETLIVKEQVVIKEDICEKSEAYATGNVKELESLTNFDENVKGEDSKQEIQETVEKENEGEEGEELSSSRKEEELKSQATMELASDVSRREIRSDDETSLMEEDTTPLALSRSTSRCTTRRVSSGNLKRLQEDSTEEMEREISNEEKLQDPEDIDSNKSSKSLENHSDDGKKNLTKDNTIECRSCNSEVHDNEDNSKAESIDTVAEAVTKIQARVRGFLTRRHMHRRGQENHRSDTLDEIPSIRDGSTMISCDVDEKQHEAEKETEDRNICSAKILKNSELENAATRIQSNYRRFKAQKRLRREKAIQSTTFSLDKTVTGICHTGEFHDCIPLPIHDLKFEKRIEEISRESTFGPLKIDETSLEREIVVDQSLNVAPLVKFEINPNVELLVSAKDEAALETNYLNFITSVEDAEAIVPIKSEITTIGMEFMDENVSNESSKEPLALSATPIGMIIEEITNSDVEHLTTQRSFDKLDKEHSSPRLESVVEDFGITESFSLPREKELLGPESSVDSIECPAIDGSRDEGSSESLKEVLDVSSAVARDEELSKDIDKAKEEESNENQALTSSIEAEDLPVLDSSNLTELKPILEVTINADDIVKSSSLSQESQLTDERIESPITMVQMIPARSESLVSKDSSEIHGQDEEFDRKAIVSETEKSGDE